MELVDHVKNLVYKLKELYFNRKNSSKHRKEAKKRYCVGLNEILKLLKVNELKMLIFCTNLE